MAKIAHGAFVAGDRDKTWQPLLQDAVRFGQLLPFYVGTFDATQVALPEHEAPPVPGATLMPLQKIWSYETRLSQDATEEYFVTVIEPFCPGLSPCYEVATARRAISGSAVLREAKRIVLPLPPKVPLKSERIRVHIESKKQPRDQMQTTNN